MKTSKEIKEAIKQLENYTPPDYIYNYEEFKKNELNRLRQELIEKRLLECDKGKVVFKKNLIMIGKYKIEDINYHIDSDKNITIAASTWRDLIHLFDIIYDCRDDKVRPRNVDPNQPCILLTEGDKYYDECLEITREIHRIEHILDLKRGYYYLDNGEEVSLAFYYKNPDAGSWGFGFNIFEGGGFIPLSDVSLKDTYITRADLMKCY